MGAWPYTALYGLLGEVVKRLAARLAPLSRPLLVQVELDLALAHLDGRDEALRRKFLGNGVFRLPVEEQDFTIPGQAKLGQLDVNGLALLEQFDVAGGDAESDQLTPGVGVGRRELYHGPVLGRGTRWWRVASRSNPSFGGLGAAAPFPATPFAK